MSTYVVIVVLIALTELSAVYLFNSFIIMGSWWKGLLCYIISLFGKLLMVLFYLVYSGFVGVNIKCIKVQATSTKTEALKKSSDGVPRLKYQFLNILIRVLLRVNSILWLLVNGNCVYLYKRYFNCQLVK